MRKDKAEDQETEIAMSKLGPESEASSVNEGFGDLRADTNLEDGADAVRELGRPSGRTGYLASKTPGWWRV